MTLPQVKKCKFDGIFTNLFLREIQVYLLSPPPALLRSAPLILVIPHLKHKKVQNTAAGFCGFRILKNLFIIQLRKFIYFLSNNLNFFLNTVILITIGGCFAEIGSYRHNFRSDRYGRISYIILLRRCFYQ